MLAVFAGVGSVGLIVVLLLASSVVRRVRRLARAADVVAGGDFSPRVKDAGADELSALARDFNAMTESLGKQRHALDQAASDLVDREALAAIGRATAVIAHELKNPLGILLGAAEVAANPDKPVEARTQAAALLEEEVRRLALTLERLLDYARPHAPHRERFDALELARAAVVRARSAQGEAPEMSVNGQASWALADRLQVEQILFNLLLNATQAGSRRIDMTVSSENEQVSVDVQDDGPGVAPTVLEQLFRPFVTTKQHGAGLGLAGARRMARENGGDLFLSPSGSGARFRLMLVRAP
jgi:two-component system sensor histidine kinase HydH